MGHFTVPCGLSGLPIEHDDYVIGFNAEPIQKGFNDRYHICPVSLPVFGTYNDYGNMVDENDIRLLDDGQLKVMCHYDLWRIAVEDHGKGKNGYKPEITIHEFFKWAREEYLHEMSLWNALGKDGNMSQKAYFLVRNGRTGKYGFHSHLSSSVFFGEKNTMQNEWLRRIVDGDLYTEDECKLLEDLTKVYIHSAVRGRQITDTYHCYTVQDADYRKEAEWHGAVSSFCKKLKAHHK